MSKREVHSPVSGSTPAWGFHSSQYVQAAVKNVAKHLKEVTNEKLPNSMHHPLKRDYKPEEDTSEELGPEDAAYYQSLIGVLRWIVELGRINITTEISVMSSCMAIPRFGHIM